MSYVEDLDGNLLYLKGMYEPKKNVQYEQSSQDFIKFRPRKPFCARTYEVDFKELLLDKSDQRILVSGFNNLELLHAAGVIYSTQLVGYMEVDCIYTTMLGKYARTDLTLISVNKAKEHILANLKIDSRQMKKKKEMIAGENDVVELPSCAGCCGSLPPEEEDECPSYFKLFEDLCKRTVRETLEYDLDADVFNILYTVHAYLSQVLSREEQLKHFFENSHQRSLRAEDIPDELVGIESRLIGCITHERSSKPMVIGRPSMKTLAVELLSVREAYKRCDVGKFLMEHVKHLFNVGLYDHIYVNSLETAISFYKKLGFQAPDPKKANIMYFNFDDTSSSDDDESSDDDYDDDDESSFFYFIVDSGYSSARSR